MSRAGPCGVAVRGVRASAYATYLARCAGVALSVGITTRPCEMRAAPPSGCLSRNAACATAGWWRSPRPPIVRRADHVAAQQVHPVLARPPRRPHAAAAVPHPTAQPRRLRLHLVGELLDPRDAAERAGLPTVEQPQQPLDALVGEVLDVAGVGVEAAAHLVVAHRRPDADARVEAAAGEDVHGGEVLGQPQRVLPPQRDHRGAERDATGALRGRGQHGDGGGDAVLQVPVPHPRAVVAQPLAELDDLQGGLVPRPGIRSVERADREEAEPFERLRWQRHVCGAYVITGPAPRPSSMSSHTRSRSGMPSTTMPGGYPVAAVNASRSTARMRKPRRW